VRKNPTPEEADPLNRLDLVRGTFFPDDESLGRREIGLERQDDEYPENARWQQGRVTFATLQLVGSNNNRPTTLPDGTVVGNEEEYRARNAANLEWLAETFDEARESESPAVMLVIQANPFEEDAEGSLFQNSPELAALHCRRAANSIRWAAIVTSERSPCSYPTRLRSAAPDPRRDRHRLCPPRTGASCRGPRGRGCGSGSCTCPSADRTS
jgi:hypothetical protein